MADEQTFTVGRSGNLNSVSLADVRFGFRQGYVFEMIEAVEPARLLDVFVFPIAPRVYDLDEPNAAILTPTQANSVVAEERGAIIRTIMIEGTFGLAPKRASGFSGAQGGGQALSGNEHFIRLRQFFRAYGALKKDPQRGPGIQMRFHSLRDDDHWIVVPESFRTPRDAKTTRTHYDFRIALKAIGTVDDLIVQRTVSSDTDAFKDALRDISRALNDARGFFTDANSFLVNNVQRGVFGNLQAVLINAGSVVNAVSNFLRTGAGFINLPFQFVTNVCARIEQLADDFENDAVNNPSDQLIAAARNMRRMEDAFNRICAWPDRFEQNWNNRVRSVQDAFAGERNITSRDVLDGTGGATDGTRTRVAYGSEGQAGLDLGGYDAVISVEVTRTDSITGLAARYDVPAELIIIINDLTPPYLTERGGAGTRGPGDRILVPIASGASRTTGAVVGAGFLSADALLYGRDFALDMDLFGREGIFDLLVDTVHGGEDAQTVEGLSNLIQGLLITVETERGATVYLFDLGIFRSVGAKGTLDQVLRASLNFREAILSDPRIESIVSTSIVQEGDVLSQSVVVRPISRRGSIELVRPVGSVSGGT